MKKMIALNDINIGDKIKISSIAYTDMSRDEIQICIEHDNVLTIDDIDPLSTIDDEQYFWVYTKELPGSIIESDDIIYKLNQ